MAIQSASTATNDRPEVAAGRSATSNPRGFQNGGQNRTQEEGVDRAKRKAGETAEQAKQATRDKAEQLKAEARQAGEQLKQKAQQSAEQAKRTTQDYADRKKTRVAEEIGVFSGAIRQAGEKLHEEQHDSVASYVDAAAEQLETLRHSLESKSLGEIVDDVQHFARKRPEVVYGGMFVAGLAAMRFLKASSRSSRSARHDSRQAAGDYSTASYAEGSQFGAAPRSAENDPSDETRTVGVTTVTPVEATSPSSSPKPETEPFNVGRNA